MNTPVNLNHYALIIGISHYPNYKDVPGAAADAKRIYDWLAAPDGGSLPVDQIHLLTSNDQQLGPTQDDIEQTILNLANQIMDSEQIAARLYFYYAGHGIEKTFNHTLLCLAPWDDRQNSPKVVSSYYLRNYLIECIGFKEVICWYDCCRHYEVAVKHHHAIRPSIACLLPKPQPGTRLFSAYATDFGKSAFEDQQGRGILTQALLEGLSGEAVNLQGDVSASSLKNYLESRVPYIGAEHQIEQRAYVYSSLNANTILAKRPKQQTQEVMILPTKQYMGEALLFNNAFEQPSRLRLGNKPINLRLRLTKHALLHKASNKLVAFEVVPSSKPMTVSIN